MVDSNTEDRLWRIFENVNKWLEYGERKNVVLLTFMGIQITVLKLFNGTNNGFFTASIAVLIVCFLSTLYSFLPQTRIPNVFKYFSKNTTEPNESDNLVFFGHIKKYSQIRYIDALEKYLNMNIKGNKYFDDLCAQIVINSQIASRKFDTFKATVSLMILAQILLAISLGL